MAEGMESVERRGCMITDHYNRNIDYIRISITDRCNLRCRYCMPEDVPFVGHDKILRYEEITRIVRILAQRGITKVKITGGEPLVRHGCTDLIREIKEISGIEMVTLTTNGILLQSMLPKLLEAGVDAVNVSLDTFQRARYEHLTGKDACEMVLAGIQDAYKSGIPLKLNCVPIEGENTDELSEFFSWAKRKQIAVRFIEMMPIGYGKQFPFQDEESIKAVLEEAYGSMHAVKERYGNGPCHYYEIAGFKGKIGFISAMTHKFCNQCNRVRLTSEGFMKGCLQYQEGTDLRGLMRGGCTDQELKEAIYQVIWNKPVSHNFYEAKTEQDEIRGMSQIGG